MKTKFPKKFNQLIRQVTKLPSDRGYQALWLWFGLSRASWLTIPRVLLHDMPDEWQAKMAALLTEYEERFPNQPDIGTTVRCTDVNGKIIKMPEWMRNYRHPNQEAINKLKS